MSDISDDPCFWALSPSQGRAIQLLPKLMNQYGRSGVLHWTRKELRLATHLGTKGYEGLLDAMQRHEWGSENAEGWLVLCGPLACAAPLVSTEGIDVQAMVNEALRTALPAIIDEALASALPAIIDEARPAIIKEHEAQKQRDYRVRKQGGENVIDKPADKGPNVIDNVVDNPLRTRAFDRSIESNRVDLDNILSIDSISIESNAQDAADVPDNPQPIPDKSAPTLTMVPADVTQELVKKGISSRRAGLLIEQYGLERCATVLACLPHWKFDNSGKAIEDALRRPEVWTIPAAIAQQKLPLLTGQPGGAAPKAAPASIHRANNALQDGRARLTEAEKQRLRCDALERLQPASRSEYDKAISMDRPLSSLLTREIQQAEDWLLGQSLRKQRAAAG